MLKSLMLLFVHLISLCCPVLFQARRIVSLNRTSFYSTVESALLGHRLSGPAVLLGHLPGTESRQYYVYKITPVNWVKYSVYWASKFGTTC